MKLYEIKLEIRSGDFAGFETEDNIVAKDAISALKFYIKQTNAEYAESHQDEINRINSDDSLTAAQKRQEIKDNGAKPAVYTLEDLVSIKYLNEITVAE